MSTNVGSRVEQVEFADKPYSPSLLSSTIQHESPTTTHGRNCKKRRMMQAQAAAENMETSSLESPQSNGHAAAVISNGTAQESVPKTPTPATKQESIGDDEKDLTATSSPLAPEPPRQRPRRQASLPVNQTKKSKGDSNLPLTRPKKKSKKGSKSSESPFKTESKEFADNYTDDDVLMGRGVQKHPGNINYREIVRKFQPELSKRGKAEVVEDIVKHMLDVVGARFLKMDNKGRWEIMNREEVRTKISKAIIELRSPAKKKPVAVAESLPVQEKVEETSGRRPKRKAALGQKKHDVPKLIPAPSTRKKKKAKQTATVASTATTNMTTTTTTATTTTRRQQLLPPEPSYQEFTYKPDPNEYYVEETAHLYHNPPFPSKWTNGVKMEDLRPVPPPEPLPPLPKSKTCLWSYDETSRVLIADFRSENDPIITREDSKFLFEMLERTDITVISKGLLNRSKTDDSMWNLDYIGQCLDREFYHKFRRFDRTINSKGIECYQEKDSLYSMRFGDYVKYCKKRKSFLAPEEKAADGIVETTPTEAKVAELKTESENQKDEPTFEFDDHEGKTHSIGVAKSALYMIDVDMNRLLPLLNRNFLESFALPAVLPGGSHCMMHSVTPDARPFMGPNLYVTPPASFTHFHQDGHGTVDSGHLCISGFNEVVMLRRLTERHKKHALWILSGKKKGGHHFDGLYSMPHGDGLGEKPSWPNMDMIEECKKMGYCPSVFTLEPGDLVHINKGRLHAFRKMSPSKLGEQDCHAEIRRKIIESKGIDGEEQLCVSVAWDWMYRGVTSKGINREVSTVLEASALNKKNDVTSLAIPELSLLQMAKSTPAKSITSKEGNSFLGALGNKAKKPSVYETTREEICKGIYPALCVVVGKHVRTLNIEENNSTKRGERLSIGKIPDTQKNPQTCALDPYGNTDFQCKFCRKELSNVYFHCDGCEELLSKDFNICGGCYMQGKFEVKVQMHPSNPKRHATLNHTGNFKYDRQTRCPCKNGPACDLCGYCLGCSCRCHTWFTMHTRLCNKKDEEKLLQNVKHIAAIESPTISIATKGALDTVYEPTKQLCDRLKDAGDEELLNTENEEGKLLNEQITNDVNGESTNEQILKEAKPSGSGEGIAPNGIKIEANEA